MKRKLILIIFLIISVSVSYSEQAKIFLVTVGPGDDVFLRWGHFAIIIDYEDQKKRDLLFDYGNFSFQQDAFFQNFIKGIMTYFKYKKNAGFELKSYVNENRDITLQELNLNQEQVDRCIDKLFNDIKIENRYYQYDHYYNNCVSQMSDFLDDLTNGAFYEGTGNYIDRSFRDLSRDYVSSNYLYNTLIMFVLGSKVDFNITEKQGMFLPEYTMNRADKVMIPNTNGGMKPLVKNKIIYNKSIDRDPVIVNAKPKTLLNLLIGIILAICSLFISKFKKINTAFQLLTGLIFGILGSILFFMSFFTGHYYIHNNWNLIMINPLTFVLFFGAIFKLSKKLYSKGYRIITVYIDITLLFTIMMIVLKIMGLINQGNSEIITLIIPLLIVNSSFKQLFLK